MSRALLSLSIALFALAPFTTARTAAAPAQKDAPVEITVYAAASLREAMGDIAAEYEKKAGVKIVFNFGSSGDLSKQIIAANKADLFFSADEKEMDKVAAEKLLDDSTRKTLLSNQLVVVEPADPKDPEKSIFKNPFAPEQLSGASVQRLSLANTDTVPAGRYAKAWLEKKDVWAKVQERVLPGTDVRAALAAVESGNVDSGFVYKTDANISSKVRIAFTVAVEQGPPIRYPVALIKEEKKRTRQRSSWLISSRQTREKHSNVTASL